MAKLNVTPMSDFMDDLQSIGDRIMIIAPEMIAAGLVPIEKEVRARALRHRITGELDKSIKRGKPKLLKGTGVWLGRVTFEGYEAGSKPTAKYPYGKANAIKAMALEYGTSDQPATPFVRPAVQAAENAVIESMQTVFNKEIKEVT